MQTKTAPQLRVGLTFDLASALRTQTSSEEDLAEFDSEETVDGIEQAIRAMGHVPIRIGGVESLVRELAAGQRWDLVFNIAEGRYGTARESQVPALLDAFGINYTFSDPLVLALALHKAHAKTIARAAGVPTADFRLIEQLRDLDDLQLGYPLFAKPVAEGTSKGISAKSIIQSEAQLRAVCQALLARYQQPVLVEAYLPGREFTVGVLGTGSGARSLGALEVFLVGDADVGVYSYRNKKEFVGKVEYQHLSSATDPLIAQVEAVALAAYRSLGCRDAGRVDVRLDAQQKPCFIEVNPLAGLNPQVSDLAILVGKTGFGYPALIQSILREALTRR
jgi:D-alanine-D-alanine ligase